MPKPTVETAMRVLTAYPEWDYALRERWIAIVDNTLPEYYLNRFIRKRDDYLDDLPERDVHTLKKKQGERLTKYKCQGNYLLGLGVDLQTLLSDELVNDPDVIQAIDTFLASDLQFSVNDPNNSEKLKRVNDILDTVIEFLQKLKPSS